MLALWSQISTLQNYKIYISIVYKSVCIIAAQTDYTLSNQHTQVLCPFPWLLGITMEGTNKRIQKEWKVSSSKGKGCVAPRWEEGWSQAKKVRSTIPSLTTIWYFSQNILLQIAVARSVPQIIFLWLFFPHLQVTFSPHCSRAQEENIYKSPVVYVCIYTHTHAIVF